MPTQPAVLGSARLGNFRLGYQSAALADTRRTQVRITIAGVDARASGPGLRRVRHGSLTIHDALNDAPNTCALVVEGAAPTDGMTLRVSVNSDVPVLLFNGSLQTITLQYDGLPSNVSWACTAIDDSARAGRRRPFGVWTNVSATTIAQQIVAAFAPGFTTVHVQAALPAVSLILDGSEGMDGALGQIAKAIGGYFYWEEADLHLFQTETSNAPDAIDDTPGRFLDDPAITLTADDSQLRTRAFGKGHGEAALGDVAANDSIVPIASAAFFNPIGGLAISESQRIGYTGVQLGGAGTLAGPGVTPSSAPTGTATNGAGIDDGAHRYAYTWKTAAGETLPAPLSAPFTCETLPAGPAINAIVARATPGIQPLYDGPIAGLTVVYGIAIIKDPVAWQTIGYASGASDLLTVAGFVAPGNTAYTVNVVVTAGMFGRHVGLFRSDNGGFFYMMDHFFATGVPIGGVASFAEDHWPHNYNTAYPAFFSPTWAGYSQVNRAAIANVALGPTGTTQRKIYRTDLGGALKLQQTIANNTATTGLVDSTADAALGALAPVADTSGLTQPVGQVNPGSVSVLTAGAAPFAATGGWFKSGDQVVRYTGLAGNTLTGIPATGIGAILSVIKYNDHVDPVPALIGVTGLALGLVKGAPVNIWVQRDDLAAQAARAIIDAANGVSPADGVWEGPPIVDERRNETSLIALCDATLALFSRPILTIPYACRDVKTKSGKLVHFDITTPPIGPLDLTIQDVTITEIDVAPNTAPRFAVTASSVRFSLDDLLRQLLAAAAA